MTGVQTCALPISCVDGAIVNDSSCIRLHADAAAMQDQILRFGGGIVALLIGMVAVGFAGTIEAIERKSTSDAPNR